MSRGYLFDGHVLQDDLDELRTEAFIWVVGTALVAAVSLLCVGLTNPNIGTPRIWLVTVALIGPPAAALWLLKRRYTAAAVILLLGLIGSIILAAVVYAENQVLFALPLVVFIAPLLVGQKGTCLVTFGASLFVLALATFGVGLPAEKNIFAVVGLLVASLLLSWIPYRPMRKALDWAWASYVEEQRKTQEVRDRQAELAQVSKSLAEACEHLEQANVALAHARRGAEEARRLKDQFATAISHELRTPLNLIIGFSEMIVSGRAAEVDERAPAWLSDDVETIYRNACHLSSLVDDVLDLGRLDAHRLALQKEWTGLAPIVHEAVATVERLYENAGLSITVDLSPDLPTLYVDPTRVRQVLINLMTNAVRYVEEGGVRVSAKRDGGDVVVSVTDSGVGISPKDLPSVFEPFRQTGPFQRRGGFGLGLTVSKQFVEMHTGSMWVESTPGQGSTFRFTLPVVDNVVAGVANPRLRLLEGPRLTTGFAPTILVVDRDSEAAHILQRYLDHYHIVSVASPSDAARVSKSGTISAIVISNPDITADDSLVQSALRYVPGVPVLRCTLRTIDRAGRDLGAAAFLPKPISRVKLRETLRRLKLRPRRALVVDDDPDMLRLLTKMFRVIAPRCQIVTVTSGEQALVSARACLSSERPDLVLLDLLMPGLNGHDFLLVWKGDPSLRDVPVIIVSAASEEDHDVVTGEVVEVRREGGLRIAEVMRVIRGSLDGLLTEEEARSDG